jgi:hypothetical protein
VVSPEFIGRDSATERDLFALALPSPEALPERVRLSSPRFICLVAWDATGVSAQRIGVFARKLLDSGAVYVCAWGPDCKRVHDIIDEEEVGPNPPEEVDRLVMTTWHDDEPLTEAIWFALNSSCPDEGYLEGSDSVLGVAIGSAAWFAEIRSAFSDPGRFSAQVLAHE